MIGQTKAQLNLLCLLIAIIIVFGVPYMSYGQDENSPELQRTFTGHTDWVRSVHFSPDGKMIASGSADKTIRLWNIATG